MPEAKRSVAFVNSNAAAKQRGALQHRELVSVQLVACGNLAKLNLSPRSRFHDRGAGSTVGAAVAAGAFPSPTLMTRAAATTSPAQTALTEPLMGRSRPVKRSRRT